MSRQQVSTGTRWEMEVGYSRAVKVGCSIEVSGTTSVDNDHNIVGIDNPYEQTRFIYEKIQKSLHQLNASLSDVVRCRIYVTDISRWEEVGKAHSLFFSEIRPVLTMVEVAALIDPALLVEIEVSAITS